MPLVEQLKPGVKIYNFADRFQNGFPTGTLTCFARKPAILGVLYGITAKHVLPRPEDVAVITNTTENPLEVGRNPIPTGALDCVYFEIPADVRTALTQDNFVPRGKMVEPTQVWDPGRFQEKVRTASNADRETQLRAKTTSVEVFGARQDVLVTGDLNKAIGDPGTTYINNTTIEKGDSGGYVLDPTRLRYTGLISAGHSVGVATQGKVILLHAAFEAAGLILATWRDRAHWV